MYGKNLRSHVQKVIDTGITWSIHIEHSSPLCKPGLTNEQTTRTARMTAQPYLQFCSSACPDWGRIPSQPTSLTTRSVLVSPLYTSYLSPPAHHQHSTPVRAPRAARAVSVTPRCWARSVTRPLAVASRVALSAPAQRTFTAALRAGRRRHARSSRRGRPDLGRPAE